MMNIARILVLSAVVAVPISLAQECRAKDAAGRSVCAVSAPGVGMARAVAKEATITTDALAALVRSGVKVVILDARSAKYDDGRRIPGAKSLVASADEATVAAAAGAKDGLVVTYCSNLKCPASKALATRLRGLGYSNVLEYPVGIAGWAEAGQAVTTVE